MKSIPLKRQSPSQKPNFKNDAIADLMYPTLDTSELTEVQLKKAMKQT